MKPTNRIVLASLGVLGLGLALGNSAGADNVTPKPREEGKTELEQAHTLLARARAFLNVEAYDPAQKEIIDAIKLAPDDLSLREEGTRLWREVEQAKHEHTEAAPAGQKRKNMAELDEAGRLASEGKTAEAASKASQILAATNDPEVLAKAHKVLAQNRPTFLGLLNVASRDVVMATASAFGWVVIIVEALVILAALYALLWLARRIRTTSSRGKKGSWRLGLIDDTTGTNVADSVISSFAGWRAEQPVASAGLLRLGMLGLPISPALEVDQQPEFDLSAALESLKIQIGTVSIGGVAKVWGAFRLWLNALRPSITGAAFSRESEIVVHLVKRSANGDTVAVTAKAPATAPERAAKSASYKMYYLIAKKTTVSDADLADKLRDGLDQLGQYISGRDPKQLQIAYETFRGVVQEKPTYDEACLYEGVALDLLERHDEAISRFAYLAKNADDADLRDKAKYNEAVSRFRKYTPEDLDFSIKELEEVIGSDASSKVLTNAPIKALAHAAKANAIAHKFIFWQAILHQVPTTNAHELAERKRKSSGDVEGWLKQVCDMIAVLEQVYKDAQDHMEPVNRDPPKNERNDGHAWDPLTRRQLRWAIENARGNAYLNRAICFYGPPDAQPDAAQLRRQSLDKALAAFRECEVLLPAGVETLTNLATTLFSLGKGEATRSYAERAISLNPDYEYAYYRLAQSWERENRKDEVVKVLTRFQRAPRIPGFKEFFNRYYIEPKFA